MKLNVSQIPRNELAEDENQALYRATKFNQVDYAVEYDEFMYQAGLWKMEAHSLAVKL